MRHMVKQNWSQCFGTIAGAIAISVGSATGAIAAEELRLQIGPFSQTLSVTDLETFAQTGKVPGDLKPYSSFLSPNLQDILQQSFMVDAEVATQTLDQLWRSPTGKQMIDQLRVALPDTSIEGLQAAVGLVLNQDLEINILNLLRAYPEDKLTVDLTGLTGLLLQMNLPNLQSQLLGPMLAEELEVTTNDPVALKTSLDPTQPGQKTVRHQSLILRDGDRKRTIPVEIYDSPDGHQDQLVLLSHGYAANRHFLDYLANHLASYGYTVVTPEHPGSNIQALVNPTIGLDTLLSATEFVERPKDISFVLDELAKLNRTAKFRGSFPTEQVTVIGHSFGGYTALAVAGARLDPIAVRNYCEGASPLTRAPGDWLQCAAAQLPYDRLKLKDNRVKQVIALNPLIGKIFGEDGLAQVKVPTLILTATQDAITPSLSHQLEPFQQLGGQKYLVVANGATHMSVTDRSTSTTPLSDSTLVPEVMGEAAEPVRQMLRSLSLSMLQRQTPQKQQYNLFFSPDYVQSLSTGKIRFRFTKTISEELQRLLSTLPQPKPLKPTEEPVRITVAAAFPLGWRSPSASPKSSSYPLGTLEASFSPLNNAIQASLFEDEMVVHNIH